jgi:D-3-phosphoglycerate dehydrogenase / 2-oxoglutarate reductase
MTDRSRAVGHHLVALDSGYGDVQVESVAARAFDVTITDAGNLSPEDALASADGAEGVLVCHLKLDAAVIARFPTWRVIGRYGAGFDNVDVEAASQAGIAVINVPDYCFEEVATHTAALVLAAWRKLFQARRLVDDGAWRELAPLLPIAPLSGCTLGLVGAGRIGSEVVRLLGPFFEEVIAYAPSRRVPAGARWADLETVFAHSDVLSLHCPLTPETANLVDAARLASMKPGALLVNVSRGGLVDSTAVAEALRSGRLGGLALDVLPTEPPPADEPLLALPNVLVTNHIAWYSDVSTVRLRQLLAERCAAYLVDRPVPSVVNAAALAPPDATWPAAHESG